MSTLESVLIVLAGIAMMFALPLAMFGFGTYHCPGPVSRWWRRMTWSKEEFDRDGLGDLDPRHRNSPTGFATQRANVIPEFQDWRTPRLTSAGSVRPRAVASAARKGKKPVSKKPQKFKSIRLEGL